jgi:hypothetical protein
VQHGGPGCTVSVYGVEADGAESMYIHACEKTFIQIGSARCICPPRTLRYVPNSWVRTGTAASSMAVRVGARSEELFRSAVYSATLR